VTYGMRSNSLTQFSVAFSALIHDVDRTVLINKELVSLQVSVAAVYLDKGVAERKRGASAHCER
jgi:hypothetical protein